MILAQVARLLSRFTLFFSVVLAIPLAVSLAEDAGDFHATRAFLEAIGTGLALAFLLRVGFRSEGTDFFRREGIAVVGLAWISASVLGALPFYRAGAIGDFSAAMFESVSGLTTTGASVLGGGGNPKIETLPGSLLLWRSLLQWIGGMGIILAFTVLLPAMGVVGKNLLTSEQVGVSDAGKVPRMQEASRVLFGLYTGLTLAAMLGYWALGMPLFDALCHACTTLSTGGFSTRNYSVGAFDSVGLELFCTLFMFLAGANFVLLLSTGRDGRLNLGRLWMNAEFRAYAKIVAMVIVGVTATLWLWQRAVTDPGSAAVRDYGNLWRCLRDASFQSVSILTSTGYGSADFQNWPKPALYILALCMLIGGCTGSTAGGLKILRVLVCAKLVRFTLRRFIRPRAIQKLKIDGEPIEDAIVTGILAVLVMWLISVSLGALALSLDPRLDAMSSVTASFSMMGCTGPAITEVVANLDGSFSIVNLAHINLGPYGGYGDLLPWSKVVLTIQMILGRLEILAPLVLIAPAFWRR